MEMLLLLTLLPRVKAPCLWILLLTMDPSVALTLSHPNLGSQSVRGEEEMNGCEKPLF